MTTAAEVIQDALGEIIVAGSEAPIEDDDAQICIRAMNSYMNALEADGVELGYTTVTDVSDIITIPRGAIEGLVANLALRIAPGYGATPSPDLRQRAKEGYSTMLRLGIYLKPVKKPSTLPRGSGSEGDYLSNDVFYSGNE